MTGAGSTWSNSSGVNIGRLGTGTLTIADGGIVTGPIVIATNAGSIGTLNIGAGAGSPAAAPGTLNAPSVAFGAGTGTINFNHTSADYVFAPAISGDGTVNVLAGTTMLTGANTYSGATNVDGGHVAGRRAEHVQPEFGSDGRERRNARSQWLQSDRTRPHQCRPGEHGHGHCAGHGLDDDQLHGNRRHDGHQYLARGRRLALGQDWSSAAARRTGNTIVARHQCRRPGSGNDRQRHSGGERDQRGDDGARRLHACSLANSAPAPSTMTCSGAASPSASPNDWFLRSDFVVPIGPSTPLVPLGRSAPGARSVGAARADRALAAIHPPPNPLPPGVDFPIIGPELATYGVVQPLARQLGLSILGTLDDRSGDTYEPDGCAVQPAVAPDSLPTRKPALPTEPACALPALLALGLGPLLRPNDPQQLSSLRRSQRQRQSGRLPGRRSIFCADL